MSEGYRLAPAAEGDVEAILRETARLFGPQQRAVYSALIARAFDLVAAEPQRPGSRARDDYSPGLRSFHVGYAARRMRAAAHVVFFERGMMEDGQPGVVIVRVLHEHMDPELHIEGGAG
jgi:toxin ParE1/3/4